MGRTTGSLGDVPGEGTGLDAAGACELHTAADSQFLDKTYARGIAADELVSGNRLHLGKGHSSIGNGGRKGPRARPGDIPGQRNRLVAGVAARQVAAGNRARGSHRGRGDGTQCYGQVGRAGRIGDRTAHSVGISEPEGRHRAGVRRVAIRIRRRVGPKARQGSRLSGCTSSACRHGYNPSKRDCAATGNRAAGGRQAGQAAGDVDTGHTAAGRASRTGRAGGASRTLRTLQTAGTERFGCSGVEPGDLERGVDLGLSDIGCNTKAVSMSAALAVVLQSVNVVLVRCDAHVQGHFHVHIVVDVERWAVPDDHRVGHVIQPQPCAAGVVERGKHLHLVSARSHLPLVGSKVDDQAIRIAADGVQRPGSPHSGHRGAACDVVILHVLQYRNLERQRVDVLAQLVDQDRAGL